MTGMTQSGGEKTGSWREILFARDYRSLAAFRILLALFLGIDFCANVLPYYTDLFTDSGVLPRTTALHGGEDINGSFFSLLMMSDYWLFHCIFIATHIVALISFGLGYRTRLANFVLFVTYTSLLWRNPYLISGDATLVKLFLLWSLFLPMGRRWSIDAALDPGPREYRDPILPFFAIKFQVMALYLFSALYKFASVSWWNGDALGKALQDNIWGSTPLGLLLVHSYGDWFPALNYAIMIFQLLIPFLIYCPWHNNVTRIMAILGAVAMHIGIALTLHAGLFPYICIIYMVLLVPDRWWNKAPNVNFDLLSTATRKLLPLHAQQPIGTLSAYICGFLLLLTVAFMVMDMRRPAMSVHFENSRFYAELPDEQPRETPYLFGGMPLWLNRMATFFQMRQRWDLFAPNPPNAQTRYSLVGEGFAGETVQLETLWSPPLFELKLNDYSVSFVNLRWQRYFSLLSGNAAAGRRKALGVYLCRLATARLDRPPRSVRIRMASVPENEPWDTDAKPDFLEERFCVALQPPNEVSAE